jgi:hypothetical protein
MRFPEAVLLLSFPFRWHRAIAVISDIVHGERQTRFCEGNIIMVRAIAYMVVVIAVAATSSVRAEKTDAQVLAENMPAMEMWADQRLKSIYKPYFDCFSRAVETGAGSDLQDDSQVSKLSNDAQMHCLVEKRQTTSEANCYIASVKPNLTQSERDDLLLRYRRQMGLFALIERYRARGRSRQFQAYLERIGRTARAGKPIVLLKVE